MYIFYIDPAHGWLSVPRKEIDKLRIADRISSYSYQRGDHVFLEEDLDLTIFVHAKVGKENASNWMSENITDHYHNGLSSIRNYESYAV